MKKDELTRLQNAYQQLRLMGFPHDEIMELIENKKGEVKPIEQKEAVDVMTLYFRAKKLLSDSHVREVMRDNEHLKGAATLPRDVGVLYAYESFVDSLDRTFVITNAGSGKKEALRTWENYFKEKEDKYRKDLKNKGKGTRKQIETLEDITANPYDGRIKDYLNTFMDQQTITDVANAVNNEPGTLAIIRGLPFAVGREKQESYTDVVLKYLYADTAVSREKAKNVKLEALNKELKKKLEEAGKTGKSLDAVQIAIIAAIAENSTSTAQAISGLKTHLDPKLAEILKEVQARGEEHKAQNQQLSRINRRLTIGGIVAASTAVALSALIIWHTMTGNAKLPADYETVMGEHGVYSAEIGELASFQKLYDSLIADGKVSAAEIQQLVGARDDYAKNDKTGAYSSTAVMNSMITAAENFEKHTADDLKPGNFADILADAAKQERFNTFIADYRTKAEDGLTAQEIADLQAIINGEPDAALKATMSDVLNLALNQGSTPADYADQKKMAAYGLQEANDYSQFLKDLEAAKADGTISQAEYDSMAAKITATYAANDVKTYGYDSTRAITNLLNAEFDLSNANGQINKLSIEINGLKSQVAALQSQATVDQATIADLQSQIATKDAQIASLEQQLANAGNNGSNDALIKDLQSQLATAKSELATVKGQLETIKKENAGLVTENEALKAENAQLKQDVATLQGQVSSLTTESASLKAQVSALQGEKQQLANQVASLMTQLDDATSKYNSMKAQYDELKAKYDALVQASQGAPTQADVDALKAEVESLKSQLSQAQSDLATAQGELSNAVKEGAANAEFLDDLYESLTYTSSGTMTDAEIREYIAFMLGLNYSENTGSSNKDYPSYGG